MIGVNEGNDEYSSNYDSLSTTFPLFYFLYTFDNYTDAVEPAY